MEGGRRGGSDPDARNGGPRHRHSRHPRRGILPDLRNDASQLLRERGPPERYALARRRGVGRVHQRGNRAGFSSAHGGVLGRSERHVRIRPVRAACRLRPAPRYERVPRLRLAASHRARRRGVDGVSDLPRPSRACGVAQLALCGLQHSDVGFLRALLRHPLSRGLWQPFGACALRRCVASRVRFRAPREGVRHRPPDAPRGSPGTTPRSSRKHPPPDSRAAGWRR